MYKESDIVVYGTEGVCRIQGTTEKKFDGFLNLNKLTCELVFSRQFVV